MDTPGRSVAERLGVDGTDPALLARALVHRSWSTEHRRRTPQRAARAARGCGARPRRHRAAPHARSRRQSEGVLSRRRAQLVRESSLAGVARSIDLGADLRLGRGEAASGGADKDSLLADALEAVIGAVFLSGGYDAAAALVGRLLGDAIRTTGTADPTDDADLGPVDPKTALQERARGAAPERPRVPHGAGGPRPRPDVPRRGPRRRRGARDGLGRVEEGGLAGRCGSGPAAPDPRVASCHFTFLPAPLRQECPVLELPEAEVLRRDLEREVVGKRAKDVAVETPSVLKPWHRTRPEFAALLEGRRIASVRRRGNVMLLELDEGP
jgi:ribonuclease III